MSLKQFFLSKVFFKHAIIAALLIILILWGTLAALRSYTHHGEKIVVPNLSGMNLKQVKRVLSKRQLRFAVVDSSFSKSALPGTVLGQKPEKGFEVKRNRTIYLSMSAVNPEMVAMPELTDISLRQAKTMLNSVGLLLDSVIYKPSQYVGLVLRQQVGDNAVVANQKVLKGEKITLVVGRGLSAEIVPLPDLFGMEITQAKDTLLLNGLSLGVTIYDDSFTSVEDSLQAKIWKQKPSIERISQIKKGSVVDCWLTVDTLKLTVQED